MRAGREKRRTDGTHIVRLWRRVRVQIVALKEARVLPAVTACAHEDEQPQRRQLVRLEAAPSPFLCLEHDKCHSGWLEPSDLQLANARLRVSELLLKRRQGFARARQVKRETARVSKRVDARLLLEALEVELGPALALGNDLGRPQRVLEVAQLAVLREVGLEVLGRRDVARDVAYLHGKVCGWHRRRAGMSAARWALQLAQP